MPAKMESMKKRCLNRCDRVMDAIDDACMAQYTKLVTIFNSAYIKLLGPPLTCPKNPVNNRVPVRIPSFTKELRTKHSHLKHSFRVSYKFQFKDKKAPHRSYPHDEWRSMDCPNLFKFWIKDHFSIRAPLFRLPYTLKFYLEIETTPKAPPKLSAAAGAVRAITKRKMNAKVRKKRYTTQTYSAQIPSLSEMLENDSPFNIGDMVMAHNTHRSSRSRRSVMGLWRAGVVTELRHGRYIEISDPRPDSESYSSTVKQHAYHRSRNKQATVNITDRAAALRDVMLGTDCNAKRDVFDAVREGIMERFNGKTHRGAVDVAALSVFHYLNAPEYVYRLRCGYNGGRIVPLKDYRATRAQNMYMPCSMCRDDDAREFVWTCTCKEYCHGVGHVMVMPKQRIMCLLCVHALVRRKVEFTAELRGLEGLIGKDCVETIVRYCLGEEVIRVALK